MDKGICNLEIYRETAIEAEIFYTDISGLDIENAKSFVSEYRIKKVEKLRTDEDKRRSLGAELLLIYALKEYGIHKPLEFVENEHGKPYLKDACGLNFNLSHSGNVAACVVSKRQAGIDVEAKDRSSEQIAEKYFLKDEKKYPFGYIWTRKEALAKAAGVGISIGLDKFSVVSDKVILNDVVYSLYSIEPEIKGYYLAVCVK